MNNLSRIPWRSYQVACTGSTCPSDRSPPALSRRLVLWQQTYLIILVFEEQVFNLFFFLNKTRAQNNGENDSWDWVRIWIILKRVLLFYILRYQPAWRDVCVFVCCKNYGLFCSRWCGVRVNGNRSELGLHPSVLHMCCMNRSTTL